MDQISFDVKLTVGQKPEHPSGRVQIKLASGLSSQRAAQELFQMYNKELEDNHAYIFISHRSEQEAEETISDPEFGNSAARLVTAQQGIQTNVISLGKVSVAQFVFENPQITFAYKLLEGGQNCFESDQNLGVKFLVGTNLELSLKDSNPLLAFLYSFCLEIQGKVSSQMKGILGFLSTSNPLLAGLPFLGKVELDMQLEGPSELPAQIKEHISASYAPVISILERYNSGENKVFQYLKDKSQGKAKFVLKLPNVVVEFDVEIMNISNSVQQLYE